MDRHLCGCARCPYYDRVAREVSAGDWRWQEQKQARSAWLDHVLAYQRRSSPSADLGALCRVR